MRLKDPVKTIFLGLTFCYVVEAALFVFCCIVFIDPDIIVSRS